jgi:quinol monooxygenase YgiN
VALGLIVRLRVHPGKGPEFEAAFAEQAKGVRANEPGNKLYQLVRSREDPDVYVVMELYDSEADLERHREAEHMVANRGRIGPLVAERLGLEILDAV